MSIRIDFLLRFRPCNVTQKVCLAFICSPLTKAMRKSFPFCILQEEIRRHLRKKEQKKRGVPTLVKCRKKDNSFFSVLFFSFIFYFLRVWNISRHIGLIIGCNLPTRITHMTFHSLMFVSDLGTDDLFSFISLIEHHVAKKATRSQRKK